MAEDTDENRLPTGIRREILSRLTHEFRTPLAIIRTSTDLLSHYYDRMNETQRSAHFERIQDRVIWMTLTLDRILLLLKLRRSEYKILVQAIELQRIIDRTQEEIAGFYGDITRIVWDVQDVALTITIDADLLLEILVQIISNALKFSTEMVRVHLQSHDDKLHIRVIDSGIGIPTDEIKHIKEIFYRANNLDETPGYGIGLAIVEQAIFACKGQWHIASELSVGTQVEIILPLPVLGDDPFQDEELNFS